MAVISLTGNDTITINGRPLVDFADGDVAVLTFPNEIANLKTGKNGNTIYSFNATGKQCEIKIRLVRGSADDKFLNGLLASQQADFAAFSLMFGEFIKKIGDGQGKVFGDTYELGGGIFSKIPEAKSNQEGDVAQSTVEYTIKFNNAPRSIG